MQDRWASLSDARWFMCISNWVNIWDDMESDPEVPDSETESGGLVEKTLGTFEVLEKCYCSALNQN